MAALCPGVQYGLSSQENFGENKDLIFVKLTDSALRAIEEYRRNQNAFNSQSATIKFLGNEGQLSFPSLHNGCTQFSFSLSSTADMEGPGGSFECLQHTNLPQNSLSVLGPIPYKMRIHANDDVYEATRHRMTVAEENHKNKCTREIKPNQTDIGRKVKLKQNRTSFSQVPRKESPLRDFLSKPSYQSNLPAKSLNHSSSSSLSNGLGSNHVSSSRPQRPSVPDVARRPLRERLIHLLALKPFKKPELYERLHREGIREKKNVSVVLKQISDWKDNCYKLKRPMWNDVNEDWPFFTEQERQTLKRRKPENLTPPGSSDGGSSGSGQSPTSTHPGSPPPPVSSSKRPGYYDGADGLPTKRQRISHYRKPSEQPYRSPIENNSQRRPVTDSRDASNMNPRSRESPTNGYTGSLTTVTTNGYDDKRNLSDNDDEDNTNRKPSCDSPSLSFSVNREKTFLVNGRGRSPAKPVDVIKSSRDVLGERTGLANGYVQNGREKDRVSSTQNGLSRVSPDSQSDRIAATDSGPPMEPDIENKLDANSEYPRYLIEYTTIKDPEQRRRYKSDFNAHYSEYRDLHGIVEKVSRRFAELEERLKQEDPSSPRYKEIKKQIVREYQENKKDLDHQKAKERFQYLHDKLSHIKRLVLEYDEKHKKY